MELSGKLTFNAIAVKPITIEKTKKSDLILLNDDKKQADAKMDEYTDHPLQGLVIAVGENVTRCKADDIVLLKLGVYTPSPYPLNDMGTMYYVYNEGDILLVREKNEHPK